MKLKLPDAEATNPRYKGFKMSDVARMLLHPKDPAVRAALEKLQGRSATPDKVAEEPPAVKSGI